MASVSANDEGINETIITSENDLKEDILETEIDEGTVGEVESEETLEAVTQPTAPNDTGSLKDLKNLLKGGVYLLNKNYSYKEGDPTDGIEINRSVIIMGNNCTIDGGNVARLFVIKNGTFYISGVNFVNAHTNGNGAAIFYNGTSVL